jgi:hypothetical protein
MVATKETTDMALQISPDIQARIAEKIESGDYPDADAVLDRALDVLGEVERLNHLRSLLAVSAEQVARGELIPYTDELREEIKQSALRRFDAGELPSPDVCP